MSSTGVQLYSSSVLVTSDRCYSGIAIDESGPFIMAKMTKYGFSNVEKIIVQDDRQTIADWLVKLCDRPKQALVITVGGTGLCPNDVTPEATQDVISRTVRGIAIALLVHSLKITPFAALSRLTVGVRNKTIIVNFPGNRKACEECWTCLEPLIHHSIHQINYDRGAIDAFHTAHIKSQIMNVSNCIGNNIREPNAEVKELVRNLSKEAILVPSSAPSITSDVHPPKKSKFDNSLNYGLDLNDNVTTTTRYHKSKVPSVKNVQTNPRESKYPLVDYYEAISRLHENSASLYDKSYSFLIEDYDSAHELIGQTLAKSYKTKRIIPCQRVSTMDGYLLNLPPDLPKEFGYDGSVFIEAEVVQNIESFSNLQKTEKSSSFFCCPINTGGMVTTDSCVVPIEKTGPSAGKKIPIHEIKRGVYIREPGSDLSSDYSIDAGTVIGPVELSLLCSMGINRVEIIKKPTISIMSTGDEIISPFGWSSTNQNDNNVIDTNGPLLTTLFINKGFTVNNCGIVGDDCDELLMAMSRALSKTNILIISGGASMGTKDYVKQIIELDLDGTIHFGRVNMKPGKPVGFATCQYEEQDKFIFCLPGNPVSAFITSMVLILPFLSQSIKLKAAKLNLSEPALLNDWKKIFDLVTTELVNIQEEGENYHLDGRMEFIRANIVCFNPKTSKYLVSVSIKQQSSRLSSLRGCDCLLVIPSGKNGDKLEIGNDYPALML